MVGIRIHVAMGYAYTFDYDTNRHKYLDARINPEGALVNINLLFEYGRREVIKAFLNFCAGKDWGGDHVMYRLLEQYLTSEEGVKNYLDSSIVTSNEFGIPGAVLITPPDSIRAWQRYDNTIDYYTQPLDAQLRYMDTPLFPYCSYMDATTGDRLEFTHKDFPGINTFASIVQEIWFSHRSALEASAAEDERRFKGALSVRDALLGGIHLSWEEFSDRFVPFIPYSVRYIAEFYKLFTDDTTIYSFRPAVYSYWA